MDNVRVYFTDRFSPIFTDSQNRLVAENGCLIGTRLAPFEEGRVVDSSSQIQPGTQVVIATEAPVMYPYGIYTYVVQEVHVIPEAVFKELTGEYARKMKRRDAAANRVLYGDAPDAKIPKMPLLVELVRKHLQVPVPSQ